LQIASTLPRGMWWEGSMAIKEFITDAALVLLIVWAIAEVLGQNRIRHEQRKSKL
jgi:hypothetical protein